ncbi:DNA polymerase III subunit gamma/tau [Colwelliaceae bacterium MEBiC 14330]
MSYQVLARKWRPKNFQQLMGQEHVVSVLANALSQERLHHAYLFTGTRGVGKTTIARIFAKSLNCDTGITDKPCGQCATCIDIDEGRFVDLLEIDAASKTKVDDTREILDNVQYAPSRGRFKVYLIDEVHMLSRHSFNALLKTLEEPPEHVKFILATTDPQKLPITVLSRCLQFHLKALTVKQIEVKLADILSQEQVNFERGCLTLLAKAARGSMRDSLSLTDQAIAQGQGNITLANIQQMLGGIDQRWVYQIVISLLKQDSQALMALSQEIASYAPSYNRLFAELIQLFHQIAMMQIVEQSFDLPDDLLRLLKKFSKSISAEDVQLFYQISINGRKDLPYASDEQAAFDMTLLRLCAFQPMQKSQLTRQSSSDNMQSIELEDLNLTHVNEKTENDLVTATELIMPDENKDAVESQSVQVSSVATDNTDGNDANHLGQNTLTEPTSDVDRQAGLNAELLDIEQQAAQLHHTASEQVIEAAIEPQPPVEPVRHIPSEQLAQFESNLEQNSETNLTTSDTHEEQPLPIDSTVGSVLATRNMLRSRKKELEKQAKKPDDASQRPLNETSTANIPNREKAAVQSTQSIVLAPEPETPFNQDNIDPTKITKANQVDKWAHMIDSMQLTARIRQLAINATISEQSTDDNLILQLNQATRHLNTEVAQQQLENYICEFLAKDITVTLNIVEETVADPFQIQGQINDKRLEYAKSLIQSDATVIALQENFQANIDEDSIAAR